MSTNNLQELVTGQQKESQFQVSQNRALSVMLGLKSTKMLTWLGKTKSTHYSKILLRKRGDSGKFRIIHNPDNVMRLVQYRILTKILDKIQVPEYIHAFEKNKSIPAMANMHVRKRLVISLDIKDFFHSIKQHSLFALFTDVGFEEGPARTLSEVCTYKAYVPQGALTSPKISNIIAARTFGPLIKEYCDRNGITLSIYADDVTMSMNETSISISEIISTVSEFIVRFGFRINNRKTKVMRSYQRQWVCGVVVNDKTNLLRNERLELRAIVHNISKNGLEAEAQKNNITGPEFRNIIQGRLNWYKQLNRELAEKLIVKFKLAIQEQEAKSQEAIRQHSAELVAA